MVGDVAGRPPRHVQETADRLPVRDRHQPRALRLEIPGSAMISLPLPLPLPSDGLRPSNGLRVIGFCVRVLARCCGFTPSCFVGGGLDCGLERSGMTWPSLMAPLRRSAEVTPMAERPECSLISGETVRATDVL